MTMWHPSNFFNIQSSIDSLSDKFTQLQHNHQTLLLKCQHDYSKAVSQGTSSDSSFQIHINNEKEVINSGLDQLAHLGKQYNRETTTLKDFIAQDYNNVKASSSANLKDTTNPIDSLKTFVESNFESIKAKVFFLDGIEKLDAAVMKSLEEHFDGAHKSVSAAFSNFSNIQKKSLSKKSQIDISQIEHYCSVNFLTIDSLTSNLDSLAKDILTYGGEFGSLLASYKKESHILQEGLNHVKQQIYTMTREGQDIKAAGGRPSSSMKHERPQKGSSSQKDLLALDQLVAQAIAANVYKNTAFNALKEAIETQQVQLAKRIDEFGVEIGMIKEANGAIVETISQSQKMRTPVRTKASHKSREGTPDGSSKYKKSLSPGLKSYLTKMSPFDNTAKLQKNSPVRKKSPQTLPASARLRNASDERWTQNSEVLNQTVLLSDTSKTALTKYGKDIDKLKKELKRCKKQYEEYVISLNDKAKKIENCIRKLLVSAGKISSLSSKKTEEDIFLFKAFQHDYKMLESQLNKLFACKESSPLKDTPNPRSMSQDMSRHRSRHLDLSGNRTLTKDDEKKSKKPLMSSHGKSDKKLSDMLDEFEKKQSLLLSTIEADKEPLSSDRAYIKSEEKARDRRHTNKTLQSENDAYQFRREGSRDKKGSEGRKERERSRLESSSLFEDEKEKRLSKEAIVNEKKMKKIVEESEIVKRENADLKEKVKRIQNKAEERKKTLKQLFDLVVEKDRELGGYKEALRRSEHHGKKNREEIENKIEEHMSLFITAFEELDKQLTDKEDKLRDIEEVVVEISKIKKEKSPVKSANTSAQKGKVKSLENRRKKLEELINVIDSSIVNKSSKELEYVKDFLSQEKDDLNAGFRQDIVAYQADTDKFNKVTKLHDLKTKIEKGDLNLLDSKNANRSKRPKALELDEFDAKQAYKIGREEPKENRSMASELNKTNNNSIVTEEHEAITRKIDQLFDGLRGDVESYRIAGNPRHENIQRTETNTEKEISDKDTSSEGAMIGRIASIGMPPRPDGENPKRSIQEIESAFQSVKVLKDEIEILKAEKIQEEKLFKEENKSLKNLVDFVNQRLDLIYEWLKDGIDYKALGVSEKVRNLRDILQQREEDKNQELENAKVQLEELLVQERQKFKNKKVATEQKAQEREEQMKLSVISLEDSNLELQAAIEACKKDILAKTQELEKKDRDYKHLKQEIESRDSQIESLKVSCAEHLLKSRVSEEDQQKFDSLLVSLDDQLSSILKKHSSPKAEDETEEKDVAVEDRIRRRITQVEFYLQQKHQENETLRKENSDTKKLADKIRKDKDELEKLIKHKENAVFATLNQYEKLEDEANNLVEANGRLEAALRKSEQELQKRKVEVTGLREETEKLKHALERTNEINSSELHKARLLTEEEKDKNEEAIKMMVKDKIHVEEEKRVLEQTVQEVKKKLSVANADLEKLKNQEAELKNKLKEQENIANEKSRKLSETEKMCANLTGTLDNLQMQYNELNEVNRELESYIEELRAQIDRVTHQKEEMRIEKERLNEESSSAIDQVAKKMAEYQQNVRLLEEKLRVSLVKNEELAKGIEGGNAEAVNAQEILKKKEKEIEKLVKEKGEFEKERVAKEKQLLAIKEEIESVKGIFNKREKEMKKLMENNSTLEKDVKSLNDNKTGLEKQKSELEEKLRVTQTDLENIKRENGEAQEQVKINNNKIKELAQELERERNNFKTGDQNLRETIQQRIKQIEEVQGANDKLTASLASVNREKDELVYRVNNLEENLKQYEERNQALKKACELQEQASASLRDELQKEIENAADIARESGEKIKTLESEIAELKKTKEELLSSVKSFEAEVGKLEKLLKEEKQAQSGSLKAKQQQVADLEREIEKLGEVNNIKQKELEVSQENIVTLNVNIVSLKEEANKLQKEKSTINENFIQKEKAMGDTEQILKSENQKQTTEIKNKENIIAQLKSDIEEARREVADKEEKIVELRETIHKETNVIAKENDQLQESIKTRDRQIEDLTKQKDALQDQITSLETQTTESQTNYNKEVQVLRLEKESLQQQITNKNKELDQLKEKLNEVETSYNEVNVLRGDLEKKAVGLEHEVKSFYERVKGQEDQYAKLEREKEALKLQIGANESQIKESENALSETNTQLQVSLNEKEEKVKKLEEQYAKVMKILEGQQHKLASEEEKNHGLEESIAVKERELEELRNQNQAIRESGNKESDTLVNENAELHEENRRLKENIQKISSEVENNKADLEKEIVTLRESVAMLEEKNANFDDEFLSLNNENENLTMANNNKAEKLNELELLLKTNEEGYKANLESIQKEVIGLTEQILAFKSQADGNNELKAESESLKENIKAQTNEIATLKNENNTLRERLKFEKENLDQLAEENRQLSSRVRQTATDSNEGSRALKEQINQLNQGILTQNVQIETLKAEKEEVAKELNLFKIETEIKEREKDAEIQALKDQLDEVKNNAFDEEEIEFANLKNDFVAKEKDWQEQRETFKNELAKITSKNQESFRNPFEAEKVEEKSASKPSSVVIKPEEFEENTERIAELEDKVVQMEKALRELDEENKALRLASATMQAVHESRGIDMKQDDNKEMSFSMPNEVDDLKARTFLEEKDSFAENRERVNSGRDNEEYVRSLHEKNRKLQDENEKLEQQNRFLKRENDMSKVFDQDMKSELREKDEEMDRMQFQMTLLKEELTKADKQQKAASIQAIPVEPASVSIAHEKEHIRTIFLKFMNTLLAGNAKDSEELLKLLVSLLELNETSKNQVLSGFKAKAQKKGMLGKLF